MATTNQLKRARLRKKVRSVAADQVLTSSENVRRINELRKIRFPSPTGKVGRPPKRVDYFGGLV